VATLAGIARRTVQRVDGEATVTPVDSVHEHEVRGIGRPAKAEPFRSVIASIGSSSVVVCSRPTGPPCEPGMLDLTIPTATPASTQSARLSGDGARISGIQRPEVPEPPSPTPFRSFAIRLGSLDLCNNLRSPDLCNPSEIFRSEI
jgi:hypothetical protein